jgi:hypothetical protein
VLGKFVGTLDLLWRQRKQMHPIPNSSFSTVHSHAYAITPSHCPPKCCLIDECSGGQIGGRAK